MMHRLPLFLLFWLLATSAQVSGPVTITIPKSTYAPGTYSVASTAIGSGLTIFTLTLDRTTWTNPAIQAKASIDLSDDNGTTWTPSNKTLDPKLPGPWCGALGQGSSNKNTQPFVIQCFCKKQGGCDPTLSTNRVRGTIIVSGGNLTTSGSLVVK